MADSTILLISDDQALAQQVRRVSESISRLGFGLANGPDALHHEGWDDVSLVLVHQTIDVSALQVARIIQVIAELRRPVATIVLAADYDAEQGISFLRTGVADYLGLPLDTARLRYLLEVLTTRHRREFKAITTSVRSVPGGRNEGVVGGYRVADANSTLGDQDEALMIDGTSLEVISLVEQIRRVAPQSATILLNGETGTGKSRLARQIHDLSDRRDEPFLVVNCGSLPGSLIERELFGHVRGAFDGASADRVGKFARAERGTLFFDGIDALPLATQIKLLRVVEDRAFEPLGATETLPLRARLIVASNCPLDEEVAEQRFRSDLYYRLNVVGFRLPPLRERRDAIGSLANRFLHEFALESGRDFDPIGGEALQALQEHDWPGNVRELRNVVARCVAICPDRSIRREHLPASVLDSPLKLTVLDKRGGHSALPSTLRHASNPLAHGQNELTRITEALIKHSNNRLKTASELGISRMTLYKKLYKYGLMQSAGSQERC